MICIPTTSPAVGPVSNQCRRWPCNIIMRTWSLECWSTTGLTRQVLGVAWDGTGYGTDGSIWGGEFLLATATDFKRVGTLRCFALPGSETAVRNPWRVAVSLVHQAFGTDVAARLQFPNVPPQQTEQLVRLIDRPGLWPQTTSMGRLFDGVASLVLGVAASQFEGQAAMTAGIGLRSVGSGSLSASHLRRRADHTRLAAADRGRRERSCSGR